MNKSLRVIIIFNILFFIPLYSQQTLVSPGGNYLVDGGLTITVDPYGAFGSSAEPAGDAIFNAPGSLGYAGTTYESAVFLRMPGFASFLSRGSIGTSGLLPNINFTSSSETEAQSLFFINGLMISLIQSVSDRSAGGDKLGSSLTQTYLIQNNTSSQIDFEMVRYLDGDLYFSGGFTNDWGGENNLTLFEFDTGSDPNNPATYLGIKTFGGNSNTTNSFEVNQFSGLLNRIIDGTPLNNAVYGDNNHDGITDFPYDITLALQRNYSLQPGQSTYFVTVTDFGLGELSQTPIQDISKESINTTKWGTMYQNGFPIPTPLLTSYDIEFKDQELLIYLNIKLTGADPGSLRDVWEQGIERIWSDKYDVVDGIYRYPVKILVDWVEENENHTVLVFDGTGRACMYWWFTHNQGWPDYMAGAIAAHEAGHMLGQYDEYCEVFVDQNGDGKFNFGEDFIDNNPENGYWDSGTLNPETWLNNTGSLMDNANGDPQKMHYEDMLTWLINKTDRNLGWANSPIPHYDQGEFPGQFYDPQFLDIYLDIKPFSNTNPVNITAKGVFPIAILGNQNFDVNDINPNTIKLNGISPIRWAYEDIGSPGQSINGFVSSNTSKDNIMDMTFKFNMQEFVQSLGSVNNGDIKQISLSGENNSHLNIMGSDCITVIGSIPKQSSNMENISDFTLNDNYPNPFNPSTNIGFKIPQNSYVKLDIFNGLGEIVENVIARELNEGEYSIVWNAKDVAAGIYFYRIQAGDFVQTKKMILLK